MKYTNTEQTYNINNEKENILPQTSIDNINNKVDGMPLDYLLNVIKEQIAITFNKIFRFSYMDKFEDFGVTQGEETWNKVKRGLPNNSIFVFSKYNGDSYKSPILPYQWGLFVAIKGDSYTRIGYMFFSDNGIYVAQQPSSGDPTWKKIQTE